MNKKIVFFLIFFANLFGSMAYAQANFNKKLKLVWSDEFDKNGLPDTSKWSYDVGGHGWGNEEKQYYTKERLKNVRVENGLLVIEAHKESFENSNYTSCRLVSKGKGDWTYGRVEVRAKLPKGTGTWPAIWMLTSTTPLKWPEDGEIDIMEHVGHDPNVIHGTVHTKAFNHGIGTEKGAKITVNNAQYEFHTYTIEWTSKKIDWYVDDQKYHTFENNGSGKYAYPFTAPAHLLLNIAIGGGWGGQKGIDDSIFPQKMEIEFVRVYQ